MANDRPLNFEGFSKLNRTERLAKLQQLGLLSAKDIKFLNQSAGLETTLADHFIENSIGYFPMPLGTATHFRIDEKDYLIPMAVEETSIIAAASKTAKWIRQQGSLTTQMLGEWGTGQIQFAVVNQPQRFEAKILEHRDSLIEQANREVADSMQARGGGVRDLSVRLIARPDGKTMGVVHVSVDTCDAMGANIINQICEFLKKPLEHLTQETGNLCILSNLMDGKLVQATATLSGIPAQLGDAIQEASLFAYLDPYRAATHNKGVLNGIDAVLIATGNDWRAVEAGIHSFACQEGQYRPITRWSYDPESEQLQGVLVAPMQVGTLGGVTRLHPTAQLSLKLLGVHTAAELGRIAAAVGLVQNLGALRALCTQGIIEGHMRLHISNLALSSGASDHERPLLQRKLEELLSLHRRVTLTHALQALKELRQHNEETAPQCS